MVQIRKASVERQITEAAEAQFARAGFMGATVGTIAQEAGVATGTVYTYFPNKKALLRAVISEDFVAELEARTRGRVAAFARPGGMDTDQEPMSGASGDLLGFFLRNRRKVVILLGRAEGTEYADFAARYVATMEEQTLEQAREQFPQLQQTKTFRFLVRSQLAESVRGIVAILAEFEDEASIREAFAGAVRSRLAAINALAAWACGEEG